MKAKASLPVMIASALFLAIIIGLIAHATVTRPTGPDTKGTVAQQADNRWLLEKAKECGGDISKLAQSDQQKAQQLTKGKGEFVVSLIYKNSAQ